MRIVATMMILIMLTPPLAGCLGWLDDEVVGVLEGKRMALTFHPELTDNLCFHQWLLREAILSK